MRLNDAVAIYHVVYANEDFKIAARVLFDLVRTTQCTQPGRKRLLYLDIEGHRNKAGGFDSDMFELQNDFLIGFLGRYLTEITMPLGHIVNSKPQANDIPLHLEIKANKQRKSK